MLGNKKTEQLENRVRELEQQLTTMREHVAGLSLGIPVSRDCLVGEAKYSQVAPEQSVSFIERVPGTIVLDIRSDSAWENGHIADAKHVVAAQLASRLIELADKYRPILVVGENGNDALYSCDLLVQAGFPYIFCLAGGMQSYPGEVVKSEVAPINIARVEGPNRELITKVAAMLDSDVRPGLIRDGGDLELLSVADGIVSVRMVGACNGCGSQSATLQGGIRTYLLHMFPELKDVRDATSVAA